ncbi:MAG: hypothetical protein U0930_26260 [Pirellulales bacterium]
MADGQVIDPARRAASFHDDQIDLAFLEDSREIVPVGSRGEEFSFAGFGVEKAAHRIEFTEVKSENFHVLSGLAVWGGMNVTVVVNATQDHGSESPDFIRMAPTPNPGLTWILSPTDSDAQTQSTTQNRIFDRNGTCCSRGLRRRISHSASPHMRQDYDKDRSTSVTSPQRYERTRMGGTCQLDAQPSLQRDAARVRILQLHP